MSTTNPPNQTPSLPSPTPVVTATLSPEEVATTLGTSTWWVREQARRGRVAHLRLGKGRIRFSPAQIAALVELVTVEPAPRKSGQTRRPDTAVLGATVRSLDARRRRATDGLDSRSATDG